MEQLDGSNQFEGESTETPPLLEARIVLSQEDEEYIRWGGDGGQNLDSA